MFIDEVKDASPTRRLAVKSIVVFIRAHSSVRGTGLDVVFSLSLLNIVHIPGEIFCR